MLDMKSAIIGVLFGIVLSIQRPRTSFTTGIGLSILVIFLTMTSPMRTKWPYFLNGIFLTVLT